MAKKKSEKDQDIADKETAVAKDVDEQSAEHASEDSDQSSSPNSGKRLTTEDLSTLPDDTDGDSFDGADVKDDVEDAVVIEAVDAQDAKEITDQDTPALSESTDIPDEVEDLLDVEETVVTDAEDTIDAAAEPFVEATSAIAPPPPPAPKRSMWPMVFAGLLLAGIGYIAGRGDLVNAYLPESWRAPDRVAELQSEIAELRATVEERASLPEDVSGLSASVGELSERIEDNATQIASIDFPEPDFGPVEEKVGALDDRVNMVEAFLDAASDTPDYSAAFAGLQQASQSQQDRVAALVADAEAAKNALLEETAQAKAALLEEAAQAKAEAEEAAKATIARAAFSHVQAAVDAGEPFADPLTEFAQTGIAEVPEDLTELSADGVSTLNDLQLGIAEAARNALQAARAEAGAASGVAGFFKKQLGVRSTEPREGDDPDAVLSRIEAQARAGDLASALAEAEQLPEPARGAMSEWLGGAEARVAAMAALDTLAQSLPSN